MKWQRFTQRACLPHAVYPSCLHQVLSPKKRLRPPPPPPRHFTFAVIFHGYDLEKHAAFELVPRLIGHNGDNMKKIYRTGVDVRVRGRGSGWKEVKSPPYRTPNSTQVQGDNGVGERHRRALPALLSPTEAGPRGAVRGAVEAEGSSGHLFRDP